MSATGWAADVLRGMQMERQAVRVGRASAVPSAAPQEPPPVDDGLRGQIEEALAQGRQEGLRAGYEDGLRKGLADAATRNEAILAKALADALAPLQDERKRLAALLASLQTAADACLCASEDDLLALCFETLCRIVGECALQPDSVRAQLHALALRYGEEGGVAIHVHPRDAELLAAAAGTPAAASTGVRWIADPDVTLGGCIVRNARGGIDARLETMLAACKSSLLAAREKRGRERVTP